MKKEILSQSLRRQRFFQFLIGSLVYSDIGEFETAGFSSLADVFQFRISHLQRTITPPQNIQNLDEKLL